MAVIAIPNQVWSMDFMSDALYRGRRLKVLKMLDEGVRKALAMVVDISLPSVRVIRILK